MASALLTLKNGGVRLIGADDSADASTWVWHDLTTLKSLDAKAQIALTVMFQPYVKLVTEPKATHTTRIRSRFRGETLRMLVNAEKHWRESQGLPLLGAMEKSLSNVSMAVLFALFSDSFMTRTSELRYSVILAEAKSEASDTSEPER